MYFFAVFIVFFCILLFGMLGVQDVRCLGCNIFGMGDVRNIECLTRGMSKMWDVQDVGCLGCVIFGIWDIWDVGYWGYGMFMMLDVGCGMFAGVCDAGLQNAWLNLIIDKLAED